MTLANSIAARSYTASRPMTSPTSEANAEPILEKLRNFAETMQQSEATAMEAMTSGADPHTLVEALAQTEVALEAAVAVRNKVVEAYQEILRMPI